MDGDYGQAPGKFSCTLYMKDTFQVETKKPLRHQEVSVDICQYLLYHLRMYFLYLARVSVYSIVYLVYTIAQPSASTR